MNADGTNPTVLLTDPSANLVTILPDGSALAYVSNKSGHQRPWLLPLSGGEPRRLSDTYIAGSEFWLTHNADKVIFAGEKDTQLCAFPTFSDCRSVSVAPGPLSADGKTVYAVMLADLRNIAAQPLDGRAPVPLTHFTDGYIIDFSLSADRTKLVITRGSYQSDVVMIRGIR
jgi:Tol biopolymer transport system component